MEEQRKKAPSKNSAPKKNVSHKKGFNYMKKKYVIHGFSVISLLIMTPVFFIIAVLLIVIPRSDISYIEKRKLAEFPEFSFESYFSGEYTAKVTEFYDDTVPDRDNFKTAGYNFKSIFGLHTEDEVKMIGTPVAVVNDKNKDKNKTDESSKSSGQNKTDNKEVYYIWLK